MRRRPRVRFFRFRRRFFGAKYGPARGVAVFTAQGGKVDRRIEGTLNDECLRQWALDHGVVLDGSSSSLARLDENLETWNADDSHHGKVDLANESGIYLGNVIVRFIKGSTWKSWPNGHPVIAIPGRKDMDVVALANDRLRHSDLKLDEVFTRISNPA